MFLGYVTTTSSPWPHVYYSEWLRQDTRLRADRRGPARFDLSNVHTKSFREVVDKLALLTESQRYGSRQ